MKEKQDHFFNFFIIWAIGAMFAASLSIMGHNILGGIIAMFVSITLAIVVYGCVRVNFNGRRKKK